MRDKFEVVVALILTRHVGDRKEICLQLRQNTNIMNGEWFLCACGHLDFADGGLEDAMVRETMEEIGVGLKQSNLKLEKVIHMPEYRIVLTLFSTQIFEGEMKICEPEYTKDLRWFDIEDLPENVDPYVKKILQQIA